jgi:hypothetical protein
LHTSITDRGNAQRPVAFALGDINSANRMDFVKIELAELMAQPASFLGRRYEQAIDAWGVLAFVHLGDMTHAFAHVRPTSQHQSLQRPDAFQIACSRRPKDTLSQVLHRPVDALPINGMPVSYGTRSYVCGVPHRTFPPGCSSFTTVFG